MRLEGVEAEHEETSRLGFQLDLCHKDWEHLSVGAAARLPAECWLEAGSRGQELVMRM